MVVTFYRCVDQTTACFLLLLFLREHRCYRSYRFVWKKSPDSRQNGLSYLRVFQMLSPIYFLPRSCAQEKPLERDSKLMCWAVSFSECERSMQPSELPPRSIQRVILESLSWILLAITGLLGNILVCIAFFRNPLLRKLTPVPTIALAISDILCFLTTGISVGVTLITGSWQFGETVCYVSGCVTPFLLCVTISTMSLTAINRYTNTAKPHLHRKIFTSKRSVLIVVHLWSTVAVAFVVPLLLGFSKVVFSPDYAICAPDHRLNGYILINILICVVMISLIIIPFCYYKVYRILRQVRLHRPQDNQPQEPQDRKQPERLKMRNKQYRPEEAAKSPQAEKFNASQGVLLGSAQPRKSQAWEQHGKVTECFRYDLCLKNSREQTAQENYKQSELRPANQVKCQLQKGNLTQGKEGNEENSSVNESLRRQPLPQKQCQRPQPTERPQTNQLIKDKSTRQAPTHRAECDEALMREKEAKITKMMLAIVLAFASIWIPIFVLIMARRFRDQTTSRDFAMLVTYSVNISSLVNPVLYITLNRCYRNEFKRILQRTIFFFSECCESWHN